MPITRYIIVWADYCDWASTAYTYWPYNTMDDAKKKLKDLYNDDKKWLDWDLYGAWYTLSDEYWERSINVIISEIKI